MKIAVISPSKKTDAVASVIIEGLYDLKIEFIASDPGNGIKDEDVKGDKDFIEYAKAADYIFVLWGKGPDPRWKRSMSASHPKYYLLDQIQRPEVTAYVDGSEWTATGHPETYDMIKTDFSGTREIPVQIAEAKNNTARCKGVPWISSDMRKKCQWYFKRECYPEDTEQGIIPLNVGCSKKFFGNQEKWYKEKPIDVFCSFGQKYTGLRYEVEEVCKKLKDEGFNVKIISEQKLSHDEYLDTMSMSKISVSAWGAGNSCMRIWESMANASCCFAQRTEILFPNKPEDGFHYVEYSTTEEFEKKIRKYLGSEYLCREIGKRGQHFVSNIHIGAARVVYMLQVINAGEKAAIWHELVEK